MITPKTLAHLLRLSLLCCMLAGCFTPPFNEFKARPEALGFTESESKLIKKLNRRSIQVIKYNKTTTVIIPTDRYFVFDSAELNETCYAGLYNVKELLKKQHNKTIYVAAFTDNVGSVAHKEQLSNARAQTILTYLWANGIPAHDLKATGYGDQHAVGNNQLIHSSAMNRRIEIQWSERPCVNRSECVP